MTSWTPDLQGRDGPLYRAIADALAADIAAGWLAPGIRLPTHRELAERVGVTVGTVTRAYAEAERRGLMPAALRCLCGPARRTQGGPCPPLCVWSKFGPARTDLVPEGDSSLIFRSGLGSERRVALRGSGGNRTRRCWGLPLSYTSGWCRGAEGPLTSAREVARACEAKESGRTALHPGGVSRGSTRAAGGDAPRRRLVCPLAGTHQWGPVHSCAGVLAGVRRAHGPARQAADLRLTWDEGRGAAHRRVQPAPGASAPCSGFHL
jgi:hypothetical protein